MQKTEATVIDIPVPGKLDLWDNLSVGLKQDIVAHARIERIAPGELILQAIIARLTGVYSDDMQEYQDDIAAMKRTRNGDISE